MIDRWSILIMVLALVGLGLGLANAPAEAATYTIDQTFVDTCTRTTGFAYLLDVGEYDSCIQVEDIWMERSGLIVPSINNFWYLSDPEAEGQPQFEILVDTIVHKDGRPAVLNGGFETVDGVDPDHAESWNFDDAANTYREEGHFDMIDEWEGTGPSAGPPSVFDGSYSLSFHAPCTTQIIKTDNLITFPAGHHWAISAKAYNRVGGGASNWTANGGSTTTLIETSFIGYDADYFDGGYIYMRDGDNATLSRDITDFDPVDGTVTVSPAFPFTVDSGDRYDAVCGGYNARFTLGILNAAGDTVGQATRVIGVDVRGMVVMWYHFATGVADEQYRVFIKTTGMSNVRVSDRYVIDDIQVSTYQYFGFAHNIDTLQGHAQYAHYMDQANKWFYSTPFHTTDGRGGNIHLENIKIRQGNDIGGGRSFRFRNFHQTFNSTGVTIRDCDFSSVGQANFNIYLNNARDCNIIHNNLVLETDGWFTREGNSTANIMATAQGMDGGGGTIIDSNQCIGGKQYGIAVRTNAYQERIKVRWNYIRHEGAIITNAFGIHSAGGIGFDSYGNHIDAISGVYNGRGLMLENIADAATPCKLEYDTIEVIQIGDENQEYTKAPTVYGFQFDYVLCGVQVNGMVCYSYAGDYVSSAPSRNAGAYTVRLNGANLHGLEFNDCEFYGLAHAGDMAAAVTMYYVYDSTDVIFRNCKIVSNDCWIYMIGASRNIPFINCEFALDSTFVDSAEIDRGGTGPVPAMLQASAYYGAIDTLFFIDNRYPDAETKSYFYDSYFRRTYSSKAYDDTNPDCSWLYGHTATISVSTEGGRDPEPNAEVICISGDIEAETADTIYIDTTDASGQLSTPLWEFYEDPIDGDYNQSEDRHQFNDYTIVAWNEAGTVTDTVIVTMDQKRTVNLYMGEAPDEDDRGALRRRNSVSPGSGLINQL